MIVYGASDEASFLDLRGWMQSVHDGAGSGIPVLMLANKIDVPGSKVNPAVAKNFANVRLI